MVEWLADVYYRKTNIANFMLKNKLAVEYYGKTKKPPSNWLKYYENEKVIFIPGDKLFSKKNTEKGTKTIYDTDVEVIV